MKELEQLLGRIKSQVADLPAAHGCLIAVTITNSNFIGTQYNGACPSQRTRPPQGNDSTESTQHASNDDQF
ncbi:hypothetical protein D3C76_578200 [compost metagenome]